MVTNPFKHVIKWLESDEGETWSRKAHHVTGPSTWLVTVKDDADKGLPSVLIWWYMPEPAQVREYDTCI